MIRTSLMERMSTEEINQALAQAGESPAAVLLLELAKEMYDKETDDAVSRGKVSDEDFTKDFRFRLGIAYGMKKLLKRVEEARKLIT